MLIIDPKLAIFGVIRLINEGFNATGAVESEVPRLADVKWYYADQPVSTINFLGVRPTEDALHIPEHPERPTGVIVETTPIIDGEHRWADLPSKNVAYLPPVQNDPRPAIFLLGLVTPTRARFAVLNYNRFAVERRIELSDSADFINKIGFDLNLDWCGVRVPTPLPQEFVLTKGASTAPTVYLRVAHSAVLQNPESAEPPAMGWPLGIYNFPPEYSAYSDVIAFAWPAEDTPFGGVGVYDSLTVQSGATGTTTALAGLNVSHPSNSQWVDGSIGAGGGGAAAKWNTILNPDGPQTLVHGNWPTVWEFTAANVGENSFHIRSAVDALGSGPLVAIQTRGPATTKSPFAIFVHDSTPALLVDANGRVGMGVAPSAIDSTLCVDGSVRFGLTPEGGRINALVARNTVTNKLAYVTSGTPNGVLQGDATGNLIFEPLILTKTADPIDDTTLRQWQMSPVAGIGFKWTAPYSTLLTCFQIVSDGEADAGSAILCEVVTRGASDSRIPFQVLARNQHALSVWRTATVTIGSSYIATPPPVAVYLNSGTRGGIRIDTTSDISDQPGDMLYRGNAVQNYSLQRTTDPGSGTWMLSWDNANKKPIWTAAVGSGSTKWNAITNPDGHQTLVHDNWHTLWDFAAGNVGDNCFLIRSAVDALGTGPLVTIQTRGFATTKSPFAVFINDSTRAFTIDASGRIGVNVVSPATTLHVFGSVQFDFAAGGGISASNGILARTSTGGPLGYLVSSVANSVIQGSAGGTFTCAPLTLTQTADPIADTTTRQWQMSSSAGLLFKWTTPLNTVLDLFKIESDGQDAPAANLNVLTVLTKGASDSRRPILVAARNQHAFSVFKDGTVIAGKYPVSGTPPPVAVYLNAGLRGVRIDTTNDDSDLPGDLLYRGNLAQNYTLQRTTDPGTGSWSLAWDNTNKKPYWTAAGSGGGSAWSALTNPTADLVLDHANYKTRFFWDSGVLEGFIGTVGSNDYRRFGAASSTSAVAASAHKPTWNIQSHVRPNGSGTGYNNLFRTARHGTGAAGNGDLATLGGLCSYIESDTTGFHEIIAVNAFMVMLAGRVGSGFGIYAQSATSSSSSSATGIEINVQNNCNIEAPYIGTATSFGGTNGLIIAAFKSGYSTDTLSNYCTTAIWISAGQPYGAGPGGGSTFGTNFRSGIAFTGPAFAEYGIDYAPMGVSGPPAIRLGNNQWIVGRNAAQIADVKLWRLNPSNALETQTAVEIRSFSGSPSVGPAPPITYFIAIRGTEGGTLAALATNDLLGRIVFYGQYDNVAGHITIGAEIRAEAVSNFTSDSNKPTDLVFLTDSGSHRFGMRLTSDSRVVVGLDASHADATHTFNIKGNARLTTYLDFFPMNYAETIVTDRARMWYDAPTSKLRYTGGQVGGGVDDFIFADVAQTLRNKTLSTGTVFADGVRMTFNPDNTNAGINVGANASNPTSPVDGDVLYNSTTAVFQFRQAGAWAGLGTGGGGGRPGLPLDSLQYNSAGSFAAVPFSNVTVGGVVTLQPGLFLVGDGLNPFLNMTAWGNAIAAFSFIKGRGTKAAPTRVKAGDVIASIAYYGQYGRDDAESIVDHYVLGGSIVGQAVGDFAADPTTGAPTTDPMDLLFKTDNTAHVTGMILTSDSRVVIGAGVVHSDAASRFTVLGTTSLQGDIASSGRLFIQRSTASTTPSGSIFILHGQGNTSYTDPTSWYYALGVDNEIDSTAAGGRRTAIYAFYDLAQYPITSHTGAAIVAQVNVASGNLGAAHPLHGLYIDTPIGSYTSLGTYYGVRVIAPAGTITNKYGIVSESTTAFSGVGGTPLAVWHVIGSTRFDLSGTNAFGDLYYRSATSGPLAQLALGPSGYFLKSLGVAFGLSWSGLDGSDILTGFVPVARGGTGLSTLPGNMQVLIGNGTAYTLSTLTQGANVTITNSGGVLTISASGAGGGSAPGGLGTELQYRLNSTTLGAVGAGATASSVDGLGNISLGTRLALTRTTTAAGLDPSFNIAHTSTITTYTDPSNWYSAAKVLHTTSNTAFGSLRTALHAEYSLGAIPANGLASAAAFVMRVPSGSPSSSMALAGIVIDALQGSPGTVGKYSALYIYDSTVSITNKYGIIVEGASKNGFGTTAPLAVMHVSGAIRFDVGSDQQGDILFRGAAGGGVNNVMQRTGDPNTTGMYLAWDNTNKKPYWTTVAGGGGGTPQGATNTLQFNAGGGAFGGMSNSVVSGSSLTLGGSLHVIGGTQFDLLDSNTNTLSPLHIFDHQSTGFPAAGFGSRTIHKLESSNTPSRDAGYEDWRWQNATDLNRSAVFSVRTIANGDVPRERVLLGGYRPISNNTQLDLFSITYAPTDHKVVCGNLFITVMARQTIVSGGSNQIQIGRRTIPFICYHNGASNTGAAQWGTAIDNGLVTTGAALSMIMKINSLTGIVSSASSFTFQTQVTSDLAGIAEFFIMYDIMYSGTAEIALA